MPEKQQYYRGMVIKNEDKNNHEAWLKLLEGKGLIDKLIEFVGDVNNKLFTFDITESMEEPDEVEDKDLDMNIRYREKVSKFGIGTRVCTEAHWDMYITLQASLTYPSWDIALWFYLDNGDEVLLRFFTSPMAYNNAMKYNWPWREEKGEYASEVVKDMADKWTDLKLVDMANFCRKIIADVFEETANNIRKTMKEGG